MKRTQFFKLTNASVTLLLIILIFFIAGCDFPQREQNNTAIPKNTLEPTNTFKPPIESTSTQHTLLKPMLNKDNITDITVISEWDVGPTNQDPKGQFFIQDVAWSPNSIEFAVTTFGNHKGSIELINVEKSEKMWSVDTSFTYDIDFTSDGESLLSNFPTPGTIKFLDVATGDFLREIQSEDCLVGEFIVFIPDGKTFITAYASGKVTYESVINIWDIESGTCKDGLIRHDGFITYLGIHLQSRNIIATLLNIQNEVPQQVILWNLDTGEQVCHIPGITAAFKQNDNMMAVLDQDMFNFGMWNISTCMLQRTIQSDSEVFSFDINPSGDILAIGGERFQLWDVSTGTKLFEVPGVTNIVREVIFSPDGYYILTAIGSNTGQKNKVMLWGIKQ